MEARPGERTTARRSTETSRAIRGLINKIYARAHGAKESGEKVAWLAYGAGIAPIMSAMGIAGLYPEQYGGFCAAMRKSVQYMERAEADGYASFLCSYMRNAFGFASLRQELVMMPPDAPERGLADPDFLVGRGPGCDAGRKMIQCIARYYDVPMYTYDLESPPMGADLKEVKEQYIKYQVAQLRGLVGFVEQQTGKKMDWDGLRERIHLAHEAHKMWHEVFELRKAIPCPMPSQDNLSSMVPHFFMPGEQSSLDYYTRLRDEVKERVEKRVGSIPDEKYRLIYSGAPPPWHSMNIFNYFESQGATFVMDLPYYPGEPVEVEEVPDPLELMALRSWQQTVNLHERAHKGCGDPRAQQLLDFIRDYKADGMVHHVALSCRATAVGQIHDTNVISKYVKIPTLYMQSDMADWRTFSEVDTKMRIDAFMETLAAVKKSSG
jgi:benzoyl-CoA reductase/2-hydroxyglutaryl-CoA dehydratase subunit BcrC/BadD/HgdB